jgi:RNA polymerase sigma factor (sigma-70 family)
MSDDAELLRRYATDRSEEAFTELVQRHLPLVYQAALRRTNGRVQLAEEVAQSVFLKLAQNAAGLQNHEVLAGWLYVATRHAAATAMRSELRRKVREQEAQAMNEMSAPGVDESDWERLRPELDSVMDELGEADRDAILLRFFENRAYAEIGGRLKISEDAARMRVDRALDKLRTLLGRRGIKSTAAALGGLLATQSALAAPTGLAATVTGSVLGGVGVASTATGGGAVIAFMTTNKIVMGIAVSVALVAGGTAVYEFGEARQAEAALIGLSQEVTELKSRLAGKEAELQAAEEKHRLTGEQTAGQAKAPDEAGAVKTPGSGRAAGGAAAASQSSPASSFAGKMDILYANPEYVQMEMERAALGLGMQYGPLYRQLGLTEGQIREFEAIMLERQQAMIDLFAAARTKGVSIDDPSLRQLNDPAQESMQPKLQALLGPEGFERFKSYTAFGESIARSAVGNLAMRLHATAPITPEQSDRLTGVIARNTPKPTAGRGIIMQSGEPDWPAIYVEAQDILSPSQLAALQAANRSSQISRQQAQLSDKLLQEAAMNAAK